jgi:mannose-6-phosphate isomerase-like protein (cupin superfamily)
MPVHIASPAVIQATGTKPKLIEEYVGCAASGTEAVSVARMSSPGGWTEPGQTPEFDEHSVVLNGMLRVQTRSVTHDVYAGEAVIVRRGEWVRYSTPLAEGAEYLAVCTPAFSPTLVHRDAE